MVCVLLTKTAIMPEYVRIGSFENREGVEKARQRHDEEEKVGWGRDLVKKLRRLGSTEGLPHSQSQHAMTAGIWHKSMCVNTEGVGHYDLGCVIACGVDTLYYRTNQDCLDPDQKHLIRGLVTEFRQERNVNRNRVLVYYKARRYTLQSSIVDPPQVGWTTTSGPAGGVQIMLYGRAPVVRRVPRGTAPRPSGHQSSCRHLDKSTGWA